MDPESVNLLIIDDDDVATIGLQRAFRKMEIKNPCYTAADGIEALNLLRGSCNRPPISTPCIMLLDLNMPRMDGFEFLEEVRNDPEIQQSVIFVLTTSSAKHDKDRAYSKNVAGYIVKPDSPEVFEETLAMISRYWSVVELPC